MGKKILIIEDDDLQLEIIKVMLTHLGYDISTASNGGSGLSLYKEETYDLILLDIHLPDISGFQLLQDIRSIPNKPASKVLLMSTDSTDESAILGISSGADGYLNKPIRLSELALQVANTLNEDISRAEINKVSKDIRDTDKELADNWSRDLLNYILDSSYGGNNDYLVTFASILTIQITGITEMSVKLDSSVFHNELQYLINEISKVVYKNRGSINHIANESIITTFGTPVVYDLDTVNAMLCAMQLFELSKQYRKTIKNKYNIKLSFLFGINSGKVYSGAFAGVRRLNYDLIGEPIKKAQMLATLNLENKNVILVDNETMSVIGPYANTEKFDPPENCIFNKGDLHKITSINKSKVDKIPNLKKIYTPKDSITDEGYQKL